MIGRREFMMLVGGAAAWPLAARAQQAAKVPRIGYLGGATPSSQGKWVTAFVQRLRELGWIEGRTIAIEYRWADGRFERFAEIAAEFVQLKVDVIVTAGPPVFAAKQATSVIPIVFATVADPLSTGLVASLGRPGGNVTGLSLTSPELASKRLELLREVVPGLRILAILANADYPPAVRELDEVGTAAHPLSIETIALKIRQAADVALPSRHSRVAQRPFMLSASRSPVPTTFGSIASRSPRDYPQYFSTAQGSKRGVSCPMDRTSRASTGALATSSTRFCAGRSRVTSRLSSRPSSILSST